MILDGKATAATIRNEVKLEIKTLPVKPKLLVIKVGDDSASSVYIRGKVKACDEVGIISQVVELPSDTTETSLLNIIGRFNRDTETHGILVQLPLPKHIDVNKVMNTIDVKKDVDCFNPINVGRFYSGNSFVEPCTPSGVMEIMDRYGVTIEGKNVVIVGRSEIVGRPLSYLFTKANATVTLCHSKTRKESLLYALKNADIIVSAVGMSELIKEDMIKENCTLIDVGINRNKEGKLCGDIDPNCRPKSNNWTPVPGGIGPMTIAMLLKNCVKCARESEY